MTTVILTVALVALLGALVSYARHDRFAGLANRQPAHDEFGRSDPQRLAF
jgi:hypothetical protein